MADKFAANLLIPQQYNDMIEKISNEEEFKNLADILEISVGIVVGRFQFLTNQWNKFNYLIKSFQWNN